MCWAGGETARQEQVQALLDAAGRLYGLDPILLRSIAAVESDYNPRAVSPKGARGLMQLMPSTAKRFSVENPMDPADNVLGAVRFIRFLRQWQALHPEDGTGMTALLAAYNAGEGAVAKYRGVPPFPETQEYVRLVLTAYLFGGRLPPGLRRRAGGSESPRARSINPLRPAKLSKPEPSIDPMEQLAEIRRSRAEAEQRLLGKIPGD
jgi:soluble lytic murein transglycosylase-like protein